LSLSAPCADRCTLRVLRTPFAFQETLEVQKEAAARAARRAGVEVVPAAAEWEVVKKVEAKLVAEEVMPAAAQ